MFIIITWQFNLRPCFFLDNLIKTNLKDNLKVHVKGGRGEIIIEWIKDRIGKIVQCSANSGDDPEGFQEQSERQC